MNRLLDRAAAAHGIERAFIDNNGRLRLASPETQRALLRAMGVACDGTGELRDAIERAAEADEVPPVMVAVADVDAALSLPAGAAGGEWRLTLEDGQMLAGALRRDGGRKPRILLPAPLPIGYHRLTVTRSGGRERQVLLISAPTRCLLPDELGVERVFGLGAQVYGLRSERDLGSGDLVDLAELAERAAHAGADFLAVNPLHALFFADPAAASPYSPSSRRFLNWMMVAPELVGEPERPAGDGTGELIDHPAAAGLRRRLLEKTFERFNARHLADGSSDQAQDYRRFVAEGGEDLRRHCLFDALHEQQLANDRDAWAWWRWPEAYRSPDRPEVAAFAREHERKLAFLAWLQWEGDRQLRRAQERARGAGASLGLYRDLAVGVNPAGSLGWSKPDLVIRQASIGAPPDEFSPRGQDWGLAPLAPRALQDAGFGPWIADIRANMRHAGVLRIDHAMGLRRLFWIPSGAGPEAGAYVRYPFTAHLAILALESHRAGCLVVGEDLGTLPRGFRPALRRAGVLSSRVLYFERERTGGFGSARRYRAASVASIGTHDLPTLRGFLAGRDIDWRERLDLFPTAEGAAEARREREQDRERLLRLLRRAGLIAETDDAAPDLETLALALHRWLARTPAALLQVSLEDLALALEQPNLPGTTDQHPNWRRRYESRVREQLEQPFARRLLALLREERPPARAGGYKEQPLQRSVVSGLG
jgi:4-alpha-glucanotransferase